MRKKKKGDRRKKTVDGKMGQWGEGKKGDGRPKTGEWL